MLQEAGVATRYMYIHVIFAVLIAFVRLASGNGDISSSTVRTDQLLCFNTRIPCINSSC